jgi:hypothetical protein
MAHYEDGTEILADLAVLTKDEIVLAGHPIVFGRTDKKSREHLAETISLLARGDQMRIRQAAIQKRSIRNVGHRAKRLKVAPECVPDDGVHTKPLETENEPEESDFLKRPSQDVVNNCIARFIDRTGNDALAMRICVVCARRLAKSETKQMAVNDIPNRHLLVPFQSHPAHQLIDGMLLEMSAIGHDRWCAVCNECRINLEKPRLPRLALANGMWIGDVPFELKVLTLPEQILIARFFPAAYIVKMYPKRTAARSLNSGLKGNVSTYRLDTSEIADMIGGNVMPPPCKILASIIGVTLVGPKNIPERTMPGFLRVRRNRVRSALVWLKANNPVYANIVISEDRLSQLGNDGVPPEILEGMRYSDNVEDLERERAGYIPEDEEYQPNDDCPSFEYETGVCAAGMYLWISSF